MSSGSALDTGAEKVDIGLPYFRPSRTKEAKERKQVMKENKKNVELERACRLRTCKFYHNGNTNAFLNGLNGYL